MAAYDGRRPSEHALHAAIEVARQFRSALTIATVTTGSTSDPEILGVVLVGENERPLGALLEEGRTRALARGVPSVEVAYLHGDDPADALLGYLVHHPHDLLVVGTRGLRRTQRLLLGSVSSRLTDRAPCPVLVVRPGHRRS